MCQGTTKNHLFILRATPSLSRGSREVEEEILSSRPVSSKGERQAQRIKSGSFSKDSLSQYVIYLTIIIIIVQNPTFQTTLKFQLDSLIITRHHMPTVKKGVKKYSFQQSLSF